MESEGAVDGWVYYHPVFRTGCRKTEVFDMNNEDSWTVCQGIEVPESVLLRLDRCNPYGSVEGLPDEELADPAELERMVYEQEWGPVLALPVKGRRGWIQAAVDESGGVDWGAFGTVDFDRTIPEFDKARYKADKLRAELKDLLIRVSIVSERLPGKAKYLVLKYVKMAMIGLEQIVHADMLALARLCLRVQRLRDETERLERASEARSRMRLARVLDE